MDDSTAEEGEEGRGAEAMGEVAVGVGTRS